MIILLHGPDTFSSREKLREIIDGFRQKNPGGLFRFFVFPEDSLMDVKDELRQVSMFGEKKFLVLEGAYKMVSGDEDFLQSDAVIVFYEREKVEEKFPSKTQCFELLTSGEKRKWIILRFHQYQQKVDEETLQKLVQSDLDLWALDQEIKKIVNLPQEIIVSSGRPDIFAAFKLMDRGERAQAMLIIDDLLKEGALPLWIFSMLAFYCRSRFHGEKLKKTYRRLVEVNLAVKTGQMREEEALVLLLADLAG